MSSKRSFLSENSGRAERDRVASDRSLLEMYEAFMIGYVRRLNEATMKVTIGGVRIGSAKYTRLAQINLKSRIITFSRFAVENVPERGRRYLVLHELAHVKEASHNQDFWSHVERFEPNYKQIGRSLDQAFHRNVREDKLIQADAAQLNGGSKIPKLLIHADYLAREGELDSKDKWLDTASSDDEQDSFDCMEDDFSMWDEHAPGTIHGGSDIPTSDIFSELKPNL